MFLLPLEEEDKENEQDEDDDDNNYNNTNINNIVLRDWQPRQRTWKFQPRPGL